MSDETTNTTDSANSEATTPTSDQSNPSNSSTTATDQAPADDDSIDLGAGATGGDDGADDKAAGKDTSAGDDGANGDGDGDAAAAFYGAPAEGEAYQIEGLPEGTVIDTEALEAVTPVLRELNLSNAGASKIIATYAETVLPRVADQVTSQIQDNVLATRKGWETEARQYIAGKDADGNAVTFKSASNQELGFDGNSVKQVQADAARALDRIAPVGFREFLSETGLGQHPMMVAFAYQAGKLLAEDSNISGAGSSGSKAKSRTEKYYS